VTKPIDHKALIQACDRNEVPRERGSTGDGHLITILLEELLLLLDEIAAIQGSDDENTVIEPRAMALTILDSLVLSLDTKTGGELAENLRLSKLVASKRQLNLEKNNHAARQIISEIYTAWLASR